MRGQLNWDLEVPARYRGPRERLSAVPDLDHHTLLSLPGASSRARPGELSRSDFVPWSELCRRARYSQSAAIWGTLVVGASEVPEGGPMTRGRSRSESDAIRLFLAAPQQTTPWTDRTSRCPIVLPSTTDKTATGFTEFVGSTWFGEERAEAHSGSIETDSTLDTR